MRVVYPISNLAAGAAWPESAGGRDIAPYRWILVENRGAAPVAIHPSASPPNDPARYWRAIEAGERRVLNVGRFSELAEHQGLMANELHVLNTGAVATTLWIETDTEPIVDLSSFEQHNGSLIDGSGTILVGGASQQVFAANPSRRFLLIQNQSGAALWVGFGAAAAVLAQPCIQLAANGGSLMLDAFVSDDAIQIIGATLGQAFTAKQA